MTHIKEQSLQNKQSIVKLFIIFIIITVALFIGMTLVVLTPKLDQTFDSMRSEADKTAAKVFAGQLQQYIHDRELALIDIADNALVTNVSLLSDSDSPAFRDFIKHTNLLGEDPVFTIVDIVGDVLYTESNAESNDEPMNNDYYQSALALINEEEFNKKEGDEEKNEYKTDRALLTVINTHTPQFEIAVPIVYGQRTQGIIIARITADPSHLFKEGSKLGKQSAVAYEKNGQRIASDISGINMIHNEDINITRYGLDFTYISDRFPVVEKKRAIYQSFIFTTLFGALVILTILFVFGRKIIVKPFQALAASQQSIASAVEGISHIDTQGRYITLNHAYAGTAGYTPEELEGQAWSKTVYPEDLPALESAYQEMIDNGKVTAEARGIKKDGSLFYKRVTMVSRYNEQGVFIGHDCFMQDISSQKMTEERIRKQQQDLQLIFDNVPVSIWYKNDKNHILRLNKKAAESMGGNVEDFEGKDTYDLFPEMAKKYHDDDLAVIQSQTPQLNIVEEYTPLNFPNGWVSTDKIPYTDPKTHESFIFVCSQDITPIKNAEADKNQLIEQLSHTNKELEQFAYIASHDLKAPLRGIEQLADWIQQDCTEILPEKSSNHLNLMVNRVQRMGRLLEDLLAYSHVARIDLSQDHIDLKSILNDLFDLHVQPFGFQYTLDVPDGTILIARKPLEMIIRNLLDNAVKHHHQGNGKISLRYKGNDNAHIIEISDDGPGIAPELHDKAFKMFQTLQSRDKVEGSGMGLAIIKKILYRYEGSIDIYSDGSNGTTFKIVWPYNQTNQKAAT
ncbi:PAS domain-containing sensor histidine kinase [bacterium]|nr:PAS domain-containing sensor histidine kinase [bacterium]